MAYTVGIFNLWPTPEELTWPFIQARYRKDNSSKWNSSILVMLAQVEFFFFFLMKYPAALCWHPLYWKGEHELIFEKFY